MEKSEAELAAERMPLRREGLRLEVYIDHVSQIWSTPADAVSVDVEVDGGECLQVMWSSEGEWHHVGFPAGKWCLYHWVERSYPPEVIREFRKLHGILVGAGGN